jgi:hypothetical protein
MLHITTSCCARSTDAGGAASAVDADGEEEVEEGAEALTDRQILVRAVAGMAGGLGICAAFSDPLVDALSELSQVRQHTVLISFSSPSFLHCTLHLCSRWSTACHVSA